MPAAPDKFPLMIICLIMLCMGVGSMPAPVSAQTRSVTDMRGKKIELPAKIGRIGTIDDGFVEGLLTHIDEVDKVELIGSWSMKRDYKYDFETVSGETYQHRGWNTMKFLHPWLDEKVCINSPQGDILNFEALAKAAPDLVILRLGDCTVRESNRAAAEKTIATIEALGFPLVVIHSPNWFKSSDLSTMRDEAAVIGAIFGKADEAASLMTWLAQSETLIRERTKNIPQNERAKVLYLGLNPNVRQQGGSGSAHGTDTPESYIIESVAGAKNVFTGKGSGVPLSAEQIYALDPDVIILPTSNGYHPPRELYEAPYFVNLQELRAVKNKRVYAMPWSPMNCARRVEYPIDMLIIAKAAHPDLFADINVYDFALRFYQDVYGVDAETAAGLRSTQLLDWMKDTGF